LSIHNSPEEFKVIKAKFELIFNISVRQPSADDLIPVLIDLLVSDTKKREVIFTQRTFKGTYSQIWFRNSNSYNQSK